METLSDGDSVANQTPWHAKLLTGGGVNGRISLSRATHHPQLRPIRRLLNGMRLNEAKKRNSLAVDIHADNIGFFAQLNWCVYILAYCERWKLNPRIALTGPLYSDQPNYDWFHDFFEDTDANAASARPSDEIPKRFLRITHIEETDFAFNFGPTMTIEEAHRLFTSYYRVKESIQSYVDDFVAREFTTDGTIGLHFRGTDKSREAARVDWPLCFRSIIKLAEDRPNLKKVFISSDDPKFISWFDREARGSLEIIVHPDEERSRKGEAVHTVIMGNRYLKGFEAIVNCLLLSRCNALIRSASFLSAWSSIFNPELPITLLSEPFSHSLWFPDRELIKRSDNRYRAA